MAYTMVAPKYSGNVIICKSGMTYRPTQLSFICDVAATDVPDLAAAGCAFISAGGTSGRDHSDTVPPDVSADITQDYNVGSRWLDTSSNIEYVCIDPAIGAAQWMTNVSTTAIQNVSNKVLENPTISTTAESTADLSKTTSVALANVPGLSLAVPAGTYGFRIVVACSAGADGGVKLAFKYNDDAALSALRALSVAFTATGSVGQNVNDTADQASLLAVTDAVVGCIIEGTFEVATAGTLQVQFAQNASDGTASIAQAGSKFELTSYP